MATRLQPTGIPAERVTIRVARAEDAQECGRICYV